MRLNPVLSRALLVSALAACGGDPTPDDAPPADAAASAEQLTPSTPADSATRVQPAESAQASAERPGGNRPAARGAGNEASPLPTPAATPAPSGATGDSDAAPPASAQDPAAILRRTAEVYEGIRSLKADFTMVVENPLLRSRTTSRGTLYQRRPDRILLDFAQPEGDVIVSDGTYFWIYYPSVNPDQVIRSPAAMAGSGGVDLQAQFVGDPTERFEYTLEGSETVNGRRTHVLTLVPREAAGYDRLKAWIDAEDSLVRRFELTELNGTVRRFELSAFERNPALGDDRFRFTPPPNATVVTR